MYRVLLIFILLFAIVFFYMNTMDTTDKEGFTKDFQEILPIQIGGDNQSISVPNNIKGNIDKYIAFEGDIRVKKANCIDFGNKEKNNPETAKIGYNQSSIYIKGAGDDLSKLNIELLANVKITNELNVTGSGVINCQKLNLSSDKRIKHKKESLSSKTSLDQLRELKPSQFEYKNGTQPVYGFIAQEVQTVLPTCVTSQKSFIANIYDTATLSGNLITFKHFNTSDLAHKGATLYPKLQIHRKSEEEYVTIVRIVDEHTIEVKEQKENPEQQEKEEIMVYGQEVDDFLTIDKNQLFTLTTSAVQELDQQLQKERDNNQTIIHRILHRISKLESKT